MKRLFRFLPVVVFTGLLVPASRAQTGAPVTTLQPFSQAGNGPRLISPLTQPSISPAVMHLLQLESSFADDVAKGGGPAFATWFADDAVTLNNGKPAILGRRAIAANAQWDPKKYQLTWVVQGAQMGPGGDTGWTWGHYDASGTDANGQPFSSSGRYITVWKKVANGTRDGAWKVALDASSLDAPDAGDCCALPQPGAESGPPVRAEPGTQPPLSPAAPKP